MRWEQLFADLEAQWEAEQRRDLDAEVADRTRRERASVGLYERLAAGVGQDVRVVLRGGPVVVGEVVDVGSDWVLLRAASGPVLVPLGSLVALSGLSARAGGSAVGRRFGLGYALRGLSRDRAVVEVLDVAGGRATGTIDAVGSDCFDLSEHPVDEPRRPENVTGRRLVPFAAVVSVTARV